MFKRYFAGAAAVAAVVVIGLAAAGSFSGATPLKPVAAPRAAPQAPAASRPHVATLTVSSSRFGRILVDGDGRTLYLFTRDRRSSTCYSACAAAWPPYLTNAAPVAARGASASLIGSVRRADGKLQVTYAGQPLYYFAGDGAPGQINCQAADEFGGTWLVVAPSGRAIE